MCAHSSENKKGFLRPNTFSAELSAGLYLVATPIGNLRDITLRALDVLSGADIVACEDTRMSGKLFKAYDINKKLVAYHDHSDKKIRNTLLGHIVNGKSVALISDAGCPLIADPGYKLVREAKNLGLFVTTIPGANAAISAIQLSGLPSDAFTFAGFVPSKQKARMDFLMHWKELDSTLIVYETAPRLIDTLNAIYETMSGRQVCVAREITKIYEEAITLPVTEHIARYKKKGAPKGEIALVIAPAEKRTYGSEEIEKLLKIAMTDQGTKQAAAQVAEKTGLSKKELYNIALNLNKNDADRI